MWYLILSFRREGGFKPTKRAWKRKGWPQETNKMKFSKFILSLIILSSLSCKDQNSVLDDQYQKISQAEFVNQNDINRIEPPNWWAGFKSDSLQLMVNHPNIGDYVPIVEVEGVSVEKFTKGNNSNNYLFIDLKLNENVSATIFNIHFKSEKGDSLISTYELKERNDTSDEFVGFDSSDAIYLITPDRFANAYP